MPDIGLIAAIAIAVALTAHMALLARAIHANLRRGAAWREQALERLEALPLAEALTGRGVDLREWLHTTPINTLEGALRACEGCGAKADCEAGLAAGRGPLPGCPNAALLRG